MTTFRRPGLTSLSRSLGDCQHAVPFHKVINTGGCYLVTTEADRYPEVDLVIDVGG